MNRLFIIGNGFDRDHKLPTGYGNFREHAKESCNGRCNYMPGTSIDSDGGVFVSSNFAYGFMLALLDGYYGEKWGDIEEALPNLDYLQYFEDFDMDEAINDDDDAMFHAIYNREDTASDLAPCVLKIRELIEEWLETIDTYTVRQKKKYSKVFDEALFLTFNYTDTLEQVYKIDSERICHIHGILGQEIVFGHGQECKLYEEETWKTFRIAEALNDLLKLLKKDVYGCIRENISFFDAISKEPIQHIYSIGFSFADVDLEYIREICRRMDTSKVVWHLTQHNKKGNEIQKFEHTIRGCGFKGKFGGLI